jgi:GTP cyclohydrolase I
MVPLRDYTDFVVDQRRSVKSKKSKEMKPRCETAMMLESQIQQDRTMSLGLTDAAKRDRLESIIGDLMTELGLDLTDQHLEGTPARVARLYRELMRGSRVDPTKILKTFDSKHSELIVVSQINFYSLCPHHLLIYRGKMHFGYVPDGKIVGLSKIPRLIQALASRPIVQEDLVSEIADTFMSVVKPLGCVARATGRHDCVAVRGVKCHEAQMTTVALRGVFREKPSLVEEFHQVLTKVDR